MKNNIYSIRLTDEHTDLLKASANLNKCSRAFVLEDALNKYYKLNNKLKRA